MLAAAAVCFTARGECLCERCTQYSVKQKLAKWPNFTFELLQQITVAIYSFFFLFLCPSPSLALAPSFVLVYLYVFWKFIVFTKLVLKNLYHFHCMIFIYLCLPLAHETFYHIVCIECLYGIAGNQQTYDIPNENLGVFYVPTQQRAIARGKSEWKERSVAQQSNNKSQNFESLVCREKNTSNNPLFFSRYYSEKAMYFPHNFLALVFVLDAVPLCIVFIFLIRNSV